MTHTLTRDSFSWLLKAVIPHAGKSGAVGLLLHSDTVEAVATDRYTLAWVTVPHAGTVFYDNEQLAFECYLSAKTATELEREVRPHRVGERDELVELLIADDGIHVGLAKSTAVYEKVPPTILRSQILDWLKRLESLTEFRLDESRWHWDPEFLARFGSVKTDPKEYLTFTPLSLISPGDGLVEFVGIHHDRTLHGAIAGRTPMRFDELVSA